MPMLPRQYRKALADVMEPLNFVQDGLMNSAVRGIAVGNGQSRLGDNAGNDVFRAIPIQGVQGAAPAY